MKNKCNCNDGGFWSGLGTFLTWLAITILVCAGLEWFLRHVDKKGKILLFVLYSVCYSAMAVLAFIWLRVAFRLLTTGDI